MRFLLARPDHLGDVLLTLPAAAALVRDLRGASVTYLVSPRTAAAPRLSPDVADVSALEFPAPNDDRPPPDALVEREASRLRGRFDAAVSLRPRDVWSARIAAAAGIPVRSGFAADVTTPFLTHSRGEPRGTHAALLAWLLVRDAAAALGTPIGPPSREPTAPAIPPSSERDADRLVGRGDPPFVLHPGSGWVLKNWPPSRWIELARAIARESPVLVVGAPGEEGLARQVADAAGVSAVTGLPLPSVAALHHRAAVVVSTDSGAVHLAAMVGAAVVGIYGPGDPALASPWCPPDRARVVRVQLACSPCGVMEHPPCGAIAEPACVTGVEVRSVLDAAREVARSVRVGAD